MLDPSTLLGDEGFEWLQDEPDLGRFVIPQHFINQLTHDADYTKRDEQLFGPLPEGAARAALTSYLRRMTLFESRDLPHAEELPQDVRDVADRLRELGSVLAAEEWLYFSTHTWLGARTEAVFSAFRQAGAAAVVVGRGAVATVVTRVLRLPDDTPDVLTAELLAKAGIKFLAVGGPVLATLLLQPITAAALGIAAVGLAGAVYLLLSNGVQAQPADDIPRLIRELAELHSGGFLTDEEYTTKKAQLLARM